MFSKDKLELQRKNHGKSEPKTQPLCTTCTLAFLSNCSQTKGMSNTSLQTRDQFHFSAETILSEEKKRQYNTMRMLNIFFPKNISVFWEEDPSNTSILLVWMKKNNPIGFCFSANINFLNTVKPNKLWKNKNIHSITRDHSHGGPYHTTIWHGRTRQEHQGIQALYQRRIQ